MDIRPNILRNGFDYKTCWVAPVFTVNADRSLQILSISKLNLSGSDVFEETYSSYSRNQGESWSEPLKPDSLSLKSNAFGGTTCCEIFTKLHKQSGNVIGFGHLINYTPDNKVIIL